MMIKLFPIHPSSRARRASRGAVQPRVSPLETRRLLSASVFAENLLDVNGVMVAPSGYVIASYLNKKVGNLESVLQPFSPAGIPYPIHYTLQRTLQALPDHIVQLGSDAGMLGSAFSMNDVLAVNQYGQMFHLDVSSGQSREILDLRLLQVDIGSIVDVATGNVSSFGGSITTFNADYGDIAVWKDVILVTGESHGLSFVERLKVSGGVVRDARVLVSSRASTSWITQRGSPRGIAVNANGRALTTLPVAPKGNLNLGYDVPIAFDVGYPEGNGKRPYAPLGTGSQVQTESRGMTVDGRGNFLIATGPAGSVVNGTSAGIVVVDSTLGRMTSIPLPLASISNSRDVAVNPRNDTAYVAFADSEQVWRVDYSPPPPAGSISGTAYEDVNGDGSRGTGEPGLGLWLIYVDSNGNGKGDAGEPLTLTDSEGRYRIDGLGLGAYSVRAVAGSGWRQTSPSNGAANLVLLGSGENRGGVNFGARRDATTGSIAGAVYRDGNGNGTLDTSEGGLEGWTVFIDANDNGTQDAGETSTRTDSNGQYSFNSLSPSTYRVRVSPRSGWQQTDPQVPAGQNVPTARSIQVTAGGKAAGNFGERPVPVKATLAGTAYDDRNRDGTRDPGEPGQAGWTIFLDTNHSGSLDAGEKSTTTDAQGRYLFADVDPGAYYINHRDQAGWSQTEPSSNGQTRGIYWFANVASDSIDGLNFGLARDSSAGTVSGSVYNDLNHDGMRGGGEPGLSGWTAFLDSNQNLLLDPGEKTAATDAQGRYTFQDLSPGRYYLNVVATDRWTQTQPVVNGNAQGIYYFLDLGDQAVGPLDFGYQAPAPMGSIAGTAYQDLNRDGQISPGEPALAGRVVYLDKNQNNQLDADEQSVRTDSLGQYRFKDLEPGRYYINHIVLDGWKQTEPALADGSTEGIYWFADVTTSDVTNMNFGERILTAAGALSGTVYNDLNNNGTSDPGELPLAGWTVFLDANENHLVDASEPFQTTDAQGRYNFTNLSTKRYYINIIQQPNWLQTEPSLNGRTVGIYWYADLGASPITGMNFGQTVSANTGSIEGLVYNDSNQNGKHESGEDGVPGARIWLDLNNDGTIDPYEPVSLADAQGRYRFANLSPQLYLIKPTPSSGWRQTEPALAGGETDGIYWYAYVGAGAIKDLNFGLYATNRSPSLAPTASQSVRAGETLQLQVAASDPDAGQTLSFRLEPGAPAGASIDPATGRFVWPVPPNMPPGSYRVSVRVTDSGSPPLDVSGGFTVEVLAPVPRDLVPPVVRSVKVASSRSGLSTLTVLFSEPMLAASLRASGVFRLISAGRDRIFGTRDDRTLSLRIRSIDPRRTRITLAPKSRLAMNQPLRLLVRSARDESGNLLDGDRNRTPGGTYQIGFGARPRSLRRAAGRPGARR